MKAHLLEFVDRLRQRGIRITLAETLDATQAAGIIGVDPDPFREAIAAALIKDEADRQTFDEVFDAFFAAPKRIAAKRHGPQPATGGQPGRSQRPEEPGSRPSPDERRALQPPSKPRVDRDAEDRRTATERRQRMAQRRALQDVPLKLLTPAQAEDCDLLVEQLAQRLRGHVSRRQAAARRGRLDVRRTLRRSISTGGVPLSPQFRRRRPERPDLVALCDLSYSVAIASRFFLALLGPAPGFFRRVRVFGYVDTPIEIWLENGQIVAAERIDFYARSDFGGVLRVFSERNAPLVTRNTLLLILGDGRNNRRPARADLLARLRATAQDTVWLNPESQDLWKTGDSAMDAYAPHCGQVLAASTLKQLYVALDRICR